MSVYANQVTLQVWEVLISGWFAATISAKVYYKNGMGKMIWVCVVGFGIPPLCLAVVQTILPAVNRLTKQEQLVLCIGLGLLLTGWAVKAYRTAHPLSVPRVEIKR